MRLYDKKNEKILNFSQEQFATYYNSSSVMSEEAVTDFLFKLKDSFSNIQKSLLNKEEKIVIDTLASKFEVENKTKRLDFVNLKDEKVLKPENFKGLYTEYLSSLINSSEEIVKDTTKTLNNLKLAISSFINEYSEDKVHMMYGGIYFKETDKLLTKHQKEISKYFPHKDNSSKAYLKEVIKSFNDINTIHKQITTLENIINQEVLNDINKLATECSQLVDVLIEHNQNSKVLESSDHTKKELVNALHISAREVEFTAYLYSNAVFFYSAFNDISKLVLTKS